MCKAGALSICSIGTCQVRSRGKGARFTGMDYNEEGPNSVIMMWCKPAIRVWEMSELVGVGLETG